MTDLLDHRLFETKYTLLLSDTFDGRGLDVPWSEVLWANFCTFGEHF